MYNTYSNPTLTDALFSGSSTSADGGMLHCNSSPTIRNKDSLVAQIRSGHYGGHDRLPSERELAIHFNVSRMTVRQALATVPSCVF